MNSIQWIINHWFIDTNSIHWISLSRDWGHKVCINSLKSSQDRNSRIWEWRSMSNQRFVTLRGSKNLIFKTVFLEFGITLSLSKTRSKIFDHNNMFTGLHQAYTLGLVVGRKTLHCYIQLNLIYSSASSLKWEDLIR